MENIENSTEKKCIEKTMEAFIFIIELNEKKILFC